MGLWLWRGSFLTCTIERLDKDFYKEFDGGADASRHFREMDVDIFVHIKQLVVDQRNGNLWGIGEQ